MPNVSWRHFTRKPSGSESMMFTVLLLSALAARQTVRYATQSVEGLSKLKALTEERHKKGAISLGEFNCGEDQAANRTAWAG